MTEIREKKKVQDTKTILHFSNTNFSIREKEIPAVSLDTYTDTTKKQPFVSDSRAEDKAYPEDFAEKSSVNAFTDTVTEDAFREVLAVLPFNQRAEITRLRATRRSFLSSLFEIRLRCDGVSALNLSGENFPLVSRISQAELQATVSRVCHGSLYAHRDEIAKGYLSMASGVRVGIVGEARYESGRLIGISNFSSLVFRIPHTPTVSAEKLAKAFHEGKGRGLLIVSAPGVGKTTALRSLARTLGGIDGMRVAVVDERREFLESDISSRMVDLLLGYRRAEGIEIAARTLSPEVILVDEIGGEEDARAMLLAMRCGVPIIATAHARDTSEARARPLLLPFFNAGVFGTIVSLVRTPMGIECEAVRLS